jgi:serine phosphatase RsbU (regulator of sigma subunit)
MNRQGELYGADRLRRVLERHGSTGDPSGIVEAIRADVSQFVDKAEVADDLTLLVLRWNGPSGR